MSIGDRDDIMEYLLILGAFIAVSIILVLRSRRMKGRVLRIYEDRIEQKFEFNRKYRVFRFEDVSAATMKYEFPNFEMVKLDFNDGSKPVQIHLTNLDVPVDKIYKLIVERVNS